MEEQESLDNSSIDCEEQEFTNKRDRSRSPIKQNAHRSRGEKEVKMKIQTEMHEISKGHKVYSLQGDVVLFGYGYH